MASDSMQRTLVLLKPDAVQRRLIGEIITRFEAKGFNIVAMKMLRVTPELAKKHYAEHIAKPFYPSLEAFITAAPIVAMAIDGLEAITVVRDMLGATSGLKAAAGTIRGDFSSSRQMNLVHASDGPEAAARELELYFDQSEFCDYEPSLTAFMRAADEQLRPAHHPHPARHPRYSLAGTGRGEQSTCTAECRHAAPKMETAPRHA